MKGIIRLAMLTASIGFIILHTSCNNAEEKKEAEFYYYPKANVYYDLSGKLYYYSLNGGETWNGMADSIGSPPASLGEKVVIHSASDSVWKENETHRKLYSGVLYNVAPFEDSSAASVASPVSERKSLRKPSRTQAPVAERKRPLKKFFQKIFGKRKDK